LHTIKSYSLLRISLSLFLLPSRVPLVWSYCLVEEPSPPYAHRCAAGIGVRIHLLPLLGWIGAREDVVYTVRV
jgi:hypothetical protein